MGRPQRRMPGIPALAALSLLGTACATNPVTGNREFKLIWESQEIATGEQHYREARRSEGGDFTADATVREYLAGNLCRCGSYANILNAVRACHTIDD